MHHVRFQFHLLFTSVYTTFLPPFRRSGCGESPRIVSTRGGEPAPASVHGTIAIDAARSSSTSSTWSAPAADALWISGSRCRGDRSCPILSMLDVGLRTRRNRQRAGSDCAILQVNCEHALYN